MADKAGKAKGKNRNADLDEGLGKTMFGPIVTGAQDSHRKEQAAKNAKKN